MLFHAYEPKSQTELAHLQDVAERVHETFVAGAVPSDLLRDATILQTLYQSMEEALPAGLVNGNLVRHLHLLEYYLEQGQPEACRNDIDDIC